MSTQTDSSPPGQPLTIKVVSHTGRIYWWPVWLVGFILAGITYAENARLAVVPAGTTVRETEPNKVFALTVPDRPSPSLVEAAADTARGREAFPVRISSIKDLGIVFFAVILAVTFGTNVPFRGLASVVAILLLLLVTFLFAFLGWWTPIIDFLGGLHVEISVAGYLIPSAVLLVLWLATVFLYDPLRYMTFTPGQCAVRKEIGDQREVYDSIQVVVEKRRTDLFRHWLLGFGAGDLIIKIPNQHLQIELPNVLFVDWQVNRIANLMRLRPVLNQ